MYIYKYQYQFIIYTTCPPHDSYLNSFGRSILVRIFYIVTISFHLIALYAIYIDLSISFPYFFYRVIISRILVALNL